MAFLTLPIELKWTTFPLFHNKVRHEPKLAGLHTGVGQARWKSYILRLFAI